MSAIIKPSYTKDGEIHHIHLTDEKTDSRLATFFGEDLEMIEMNLVQTYILMKKLGYITQEQFDSLVDEVKDVLPD